VNSSLSRWAATAFVIGLVAVLSSGCIVPGAGGAGYGLDYYEPSGVAIGGWGPDYRVAPYREGEHRQASAGGRPAAHAYRAAPASRAMPSIPSGSRSGGGGGRGGGGHR
jgi:hypothetical protein